MAGIKDIAKATGLSLATVSRVLNKSPLVSQKTREKVVKIIKELDYRPNMMAAALRSGKSNIIGVIVPEINNSFFSSVINGIEQKLGMLGYHIIIAQSHDKFEDEKKAIASLIQLNVDGIVLSLAKETTNLSFIKEQIENSLPVVFFDRLPHKEKLNTIVSDDYKGAIMATKHLIDQGCRNIVHIVGDIKVSIFNARKKGFIAAMDKNKVMLSKDSMLSFSMNITKDIAKLKELCNGSRSVDGFFVYGDDACLYLMNILRSLNIKVPKQVKVIGFGNADFGKLVHPSITTIDQKSNQMGIKTAEMIYDFIHNEQQEITSQVLTPELIIRESTREY